MRIFGFLGLIIVLAFLLFQYRSSVTSVGQQQGQSSSLSKSVEDDVNNSVSGFQKKLDDAMNQSNE
jgi:hypothetical protein